MLLLLMPLWTYWIYHSSGMDNISGFKKMWEDADFILNLEADTETPENDRKKTTSNSQPKAFSQAKNTLDSKLHRQTGLLTALTTLKTLDFPQLFLWENTTLFGKVTVPQFQIKPPHCPKLREAELWTQPDIAESSLTHFPIGRGCS